MVTELRLSSLGGFEMYGLVKFAAGAVAALALSTGIGVGAAQASTWVLDYTANNAGDTPFSAVLRFSSRFERLERSGAASNNHRASAAFVDGDAGRPPRPDRQRRQDPAASSAPGRPVHLRQQLLHPR